MGIFEEIRRRLRSLRSGKTALKIAAALCLLVLAHCDYDKMINDAAINTYQMSLPEMPEGTVPIDGGVTVLRNTPPQDIRSPVPFSVQTVQSGTWVYNNFCIQCHGPRQDGNGTVGQSFIPPPADFHSPRVQDQGDGELYLKVSLGYLRMPPLYSTVSPADRWFVVQYIRSLKTEGQGKR